ncbi:response regulator transcription factor [Planomonospora sp. ID82291]|uniref:response regulator transcription factor n=1 Tax=Planomonospora sp. ID82291 TaxID=2738136 RepID=UPI0018C3CCC4|nr:response regulator [Planomonospora sp. ID82291]MBG0816628.1 response regulator [Planomonospora sp. ID82291]
MATILLVEDDTNIKDLVTFRLEMEGHEVTAVDDGRDALAVAQADPPDLAVLDVMLPGYSGLEICRKLRADASTAEIAIIMLTARGQESDVEAGFDAGADDYVTKPFSPRELARRVEALLARGQH